MRRERIRVATAHPGLSSLLQGAATIARRVASADRAVAALPTLRRSGSLVTEQVGRGTPLPSRALRDVVRALDCGETIVVPDIAKPRSFPSLHTAPLGVSSLAAVPLCPQGSGGFLLVTSEMRRGFTTLEMDALELVAARTTDAIRHLHEMTALRHHVARELHDTVTQTLTLLMFSLDELLGATKDDASRSLALVARSHAGEALRQLRRLMDRSVDGADEGVRPSLQRLLDELARTGTEVRLIGGLGEDGLPEPVSACLLNIAHEALMNVRRHAGARHVTVGLRRTHDAASLEVTDDGRGIGAHTRSDDRAAGRGLSIMRERATLLGGAVTARVRPGGGTAVTARVPLPR